ncbi:MAG TPA: hypothetical protein VK212_03410 [Lentimicrobium sp.]|nr:hypothetical protein [Lentimicrobium sp.]
MKHLIIFLLAILLFGCNTREDERLDFEEIFGLTRQTFLIDNRKDTILIGEKGTQVFIPGHLTSAILSDKDTFKVVLKEFYSKSDMILAGLSTTSNGKLLESNGMISLDMYLNSQKVNDIRKPVSIRFTNSDEITRYSVFSGLPIDMNINWESDTLTKNYHIFYNMVIYGSPCYNCDYGVYAIFSDTVLWKNNYSQIDSIVTFTKSKDTISFYDFRKNQAFQYDQTIQDIQSLEIIFNTSDLGWINCDRFLDFNELTDLQIKSNAKSNPYYFLVFKDINSIMPNITDNGFSNVPVGQRVFLIGIENIDNKLYFGMTEMFEVKKEMVLELEFQESDIDYVRREINKLN